LKRILIADDEEILRMLILDTLEDLEYEIDEAEDGAQALQMITDQSYDLVILDFMMPHLTGVEVLENLTAAQKASINILMLTAKTQESDKEKMISAGANYFMAKPFSPVALLSLIEEIIV